MLKDNILADCMSINMSFKIGKLIVINDESTLQKHRVQVHASVLRNIDTLSADVARVLSLSFTSILFRHSNPTTPNKDPNPTPNKDTNPTGVTPIFATLLTMFSLFDQCAVTLYSKLGETTTIEAVFFGVNANQTIINRARPEHIDLLLSAFGFVTRQPVDWRSLLTMLRERIVHGQGVFFKSDLEKISHFIVANGFKTRERDIYLSNNNGNGHDFDFMCFLLFASEKLTSLVRLIQCY